MSGDYLHVSLWQTARLWAPGRAEIRTSAFMREQLRAKAYVVLLLVVRCGRPRRGCGDARTGLGAGAGRNSRVPRLLTAALRAKKQKQIRSHQLRGTQSIWLGPGRSQRQILSPRSTRGYRQETARCSRHDPEGMLSWHPPTRFRARGLGLGGARGGRGPAAPRLVICQAGWVWLTGVPTPLASGSPGYS
jgi:hypothetical protein